MNLTEKRKDNRPFGAGVRVGILLVLLLLICWRGAVPAVANSQIRKNTTWIMVGDSYTCRPSGQKEKSWPYQLREKLGLKGSEVCFVRKPGYGFANKGKQFYTELKKLKSSKTVRRILIVGGVRNDKFCSKKKIHTMFHKTAVLLRKRYPNAEIYYAAPNWDKLSAEKRKLLRTRKVWYKKFCKEEGWTYLASVQKVLYNVGGWYEADGHHPNEKGANIISNALYRALKDKA